MSSRFRENLIIVVIGALVLVAGINFRGIGKELRLIFDMLTPVIAGSILALFLSVPVNGMERFLERIFQKRGWKIAEKKRQFLALLLAVLCIFGVLFLIGTLLVPELVQSVANLGATLEMRLPDWAAALEKQGLDSKWLDELFGRLEWDTVMQEIYGMAGGILSSVVSAISSAAGTLVTVGFALVISLYLILDRRRLARQARQLSCAYLPERLADSLCKSCRLFLNCFSRYLSGQCVEAVILGILILLSFLVMKLPYAPLIAALTAVCALIPYVGAFISCATGVFLIFLVSPEKTILALGVYLIVQFVENQFIYPHVVGSSIGLPPVFMLVAALIGGNLFGIIGMLFFIPLVAALYILIGGNVRARLRTQRSESSK